MGCIMTETDNKTEKKDTNLNEEILNDCKLSLRNFTKYQLSIPSIHEDFDVGSLIKICKHFSNLDLLEQGKNTANIGLNSGSGGFNVTFIETVAGTATVEDDSNDDDDVSHHHAVSFKE